MTAPPAIVLASRSPYRRKLLQRLVADFECVTTAVDESPRKSEQPLELALRLAQAKAAAGAAQRPDAVIVGSDQVAALDGRVLGKPGDHANAVRQLTACSGRPVEFHTAVCVMGGEKDFTDTYVDRTVVQFRELDSALIERYLQKDQPYDCAGSFKAEGTGVVLFERVETTDPTAIIGLPLIWLAGCLQRAGVPLL